MVLAMVGEWVVLCCVVLDYCYADLEYSSVKLARRVSRSNASSAKVPRAFGGARFLFHCESDAEASPGVKPRSCVAQATC